MNKVLDSAAVLYSPGRNDECYTPAYAVRAILPLLEPFAVYWCPFDTEESEFVKVLREAGFMVVHSHISTGQDFHAYEPPEWDAILSNPPFTGKADIFRRALSFGKPFGLLMSLTWLNDSAPKKLFAQRRLELLMFEERVRYKGQADKVTFSSAYFCHQLLPQQIHMASLRPYGWPDDRAPLPRSSEGVEPHHQLTLFGGAL